MIILCLGGYSSGSTWVFNVVREVIAQRGKPAVSLYATSAAHLLAQVPITGGDVVVKAHAIERDLLALLHHADVRVIRTWRDPRDAAASLMARFGHCYHEAVGLLEDSLANLCAVPARPYLLDLQYEDDFPGDPNTVSRIAALLEIPLTRSDANVISAGLNLTSVRRETEALLKIAGGPVKPDQFDPDTHWHPGHVRTGAVGDWDNWLDERLARVVCEALDPLATPDAWQKQVIRWDALLFLDSDEQRPSDDGRVRLADAGLPTIKGPAFKLPAGRWRALIDVAPAQRGDQLTFLVEIRAFFLSPIVLTSRLLTLSGAEAGGIEIEFDHCDHSAAIDVRLSVAAANLATALIFRGVSLTYVGPSEVNISGEARRVVPL